METDIIQLTARVEALEKRLEKDEHMTVDALKKTNKSILDLAQLFQQLVEKLKKGAAAKEE